jgi:hypothetical protein
MSELTNPELRIPNKIQISIRKSQTGVLNRESERIPRCLQRGASILLGSQNKAEYNIRCSVFDVHAFK